MNSRYFVTGDASTTGDFPHAADFAFRQMIGVHGYGKALEAIFGVLLEGQQDRILEALGMQRRIDPCDCGPVHRWDCTAREAPGSATAAPDAQMPQEAARSALEASHVVQWIELSSRAKNFGCKIWPTGHGFAIQVDAANDGMWREVGSLFELRVAFSDYVAAERGHGREPRPPQDPLSAAIVKAAERAGLETGSLGDRPAQEALLGLVQNMGQLLYQQQMEEMARGPVQTIKFVEEDGTERSISWEAGDPSVGMSEGYAADDDHWSRAIKGLKSTWTALARVGSRRDARKIIESTLDEVSPDWKAKAKGGRS